jgi:hypothetical protein
LIETNGVHFQIEIHENNGANSRGTKKPSRVLGKGGRTIKKFGTAHQFEKTPSHDEMIGSQECGGTEVVIVHNVFVHEND